ncbi:lysophospholipid acyltransferase family protein [Sulfurospirillum sp. 1307]|jgi:lysophospholipid acyltransferase (LPLAT)-like uncharacterized protein
MGKLLSKTKRRALEVKILPPILYILLNLLYFTCKKRYHFDKSKVVDSPCVFVFWHGELMMLVQGYIDYRKSKNIDTIVSAHHDGEIATRLLTLFGGGTIRGSSTRGGLKALVEAFKSIKKGRDVGITPDGPKGPRHSVADGAVLIAQKMKVPIVAMNVNASRAWRANSWDRFMIPKPFCTLDYYYGDPFYINDLSLEEAKEKIKKELMKHAF